MTLAEWKQLVEWTAFMVGVVVAFLLVLSAGLRVWMSKEGVGDTAQVIELQVTLIEPERGEPLDEG